MHTVTLIPGDGIGPEVSNAAVRVVEASGVAIAWERVEAGSEVMHKYGTPVPDEVINVIIKNRVALKGPLATPIGTGFASANVTLRKRLNLYANVRPAKTIPGVKTRFENVDLIVIRENSEDLYSGLEHIVIPGVVESLKIITETACLRIGRFAFEYARRNGRKKVTAVHKANIMKLADGLFLECMRKIARDYTEIEYQELIVDNTCMQLVTRPEQFDVMVMENLYGDIVSDLCAGLIGGLGLTASANIGEGDVAMFEAVHGTAPDIAGQNKANPIALILSAVLMLRHMGEQEAAERIERGVMAMLAEGKVRTRDLGGSATTTDVCDAIIEKMMA
jgi:isocitrate dehydrogenase (NAD+)